ncbi:MAG: glycosyltransferase [Anaerolineae bacterium]
MLEPIMRPQARRHLKRIGPADLVIGIPTYCNATTVGMVVQTVLDGVTAELNDLRVVIINADAGPSCDTRQAVMDAAADAPIPVVIGGYTGRLGRGSAMRAILHAALDLDARLVVALDAHTTSITPDWISALARPILDGQVDLMMPRYQWPLPDGGLSDLIFYPLTRALWGRSLRQPGAGDCGLSAALAQTIVEYDVWETEVAGAGFEVWLSSVALTEGPEGGNLWRVGQVDLGEKSYVPRTVAAHFPTVFRQAVGTLLRQVHLRRGFWQTLPPVQQTPTFPGPPPSTREPIPPHNVTHLIDALMVGWTEYRALWQHILTPINLAMIETLAVQPIEHFTFPPDLWARVISDFAVVYNNGEHDPDRIVDSLLPLYQGRLASLWQDVTGLTPVGREGTVAAQAVEFELNRDYLLRRWTTYRP